MTDTRADAPPVAPDDRRLQGWYHTIDLGGGVVTKGRYDHRPVVDAYGLPDSLAGKSALDVGTCDGFWAFELERRGADPVVAVDIAQWGDFDLLPWIRDAMGPENAAKPSGGRFAFAHRLRGSSVERRICNVYDLSPELVGTFDFVFCGDLLLHLQNPLRALVNIRSVTRETAVVATLAEREIEREHPDRPWLAFGFRQAEEAHGKRLGEGCVYWRFSSAALREMLEYAGFERTEALPPFATPGGPELAAVVARV
jgi:tRNA (mo5U34)-methyltransferase